MTGRTAMVCALVALSPAAWLSEGRAARQWDPYTAIEFVVAGTDDPIAPSNVGDNGTVTRTFYVTTHRDADHWIDPEESPPGEDWPVEALPLTDVDYSTDAPPPGGLAPGDGCFIYTAPEVGGAFEVVLTGTDRSQVIAPGESGNRHDPDNTDNWWDDDVD